MVNDLRADITHITGCIFEYSIIETYLQYAEVTFRLISLLLTLGNINDLGFLISDYKYSSNSSFFGINNWKEFLGNYLKSSNI